MATGVHVWSTTAATNSTSDSTINWAEGQAPSTVNDSARAVMAKVAEYAKDTAGTLTTAGTTTAYTIATPNATYASLTELNGVKLKVRFNATNGASPTLNVASLGAKAIQTASGTAVATGAILADSVHDVTYDNAIPAFLLSGALSGFAGNVTVGGTLGVTGATTLAALSATTGAFSSTLAATGNFAINTDKFTVTASSGNTLVAGTLAVTGDVAFNTNKFTVAASSGNTLVAGTLAITGAATLTGALTANNAAGIAARNTPKAFVHFSTNGSAVVTLNNSFNVSGVATATVETINGFQLTLSNAVAGANLCVIATPRVTNATTTVTFLTSTTTTTTVDFIIVNNVGSAVRNNLNVHIAIFDNG